MVLEVETKTVDTNLDVLPEITFVEAKAAGITVAEVTGAEFDRFSPSLSRLQALVYAVYTPDGKPRDMIRVDGDKSVHVAYLVAEGLNLSDLFQATPSKMFPEIADELRGYDKVGGFLRVEWAKANEQGFAGIEGRQLMNWTMPPGKMVGYSGSLTINPLLPRSNRLALQTAFHREMYEIARREGFAEHLYTILAPHVLDFVSDSGLHFEHISEAERSTDSAAQVVFGNWPKYWSSNPDVYRFIPQDLPQPEWTQT